MSDSEEARNRLGLTTYGLPSLGTSPHHSPAGLGRPSHAHQPAFPQGLARYLPTEINAASPIRSIAGRLMNHHDPDVRSAAAEILRHVERYETGR